MSGRATRKRKETAAPAPPPAAASSSSTATRSARRSPSRGGVAAASSPSSKKKPSSTSSKKPAKKKPKRDHNEAATAEEVEAEATATEDHDVTMTDTEKQVSPTTAAASSSSSSAPFDSYLPRDLLRIVFQYSPPSQLSRYVSACPWITSDRLLCRSSMRYYAAQAPIKITEHTHSYHEQTLAGNFINNYPFYLNTTQRKSKKFSEESWELSASEFLYNPEDLEWNNAMGISLEFMEILRESGMWEDEVNAIHAPDSAQALAVFRDTPEYQTYARLAPYNSMLQRVNLPLVDIYHDLPLSSSDAGEPQVYERPLHQMEKELWRKWEGPVEKLDVTVPVGNEKTGSNGGDAVAASSSTCSPPAPSTTIAVPPVWSVPIFRSRSSFLSTFDSLFLYHLWHSTIDWSRFLCVGGSVLRSVLNPKFHDFDVYKDDPAAGLEKQDVDFFWTSSADFYAYTESYLSWKRRVRVWRGRENVRVVSDTDYVQVVEVRFTEESDNEEKATEEFVPRSPPPKGKKKHQQSATERRKCKRDELLVEEAEEDDKGEGDDEENEDDSKDYSKPLPTGGRIVTFNFIWYDSSLSPSSILNIFDLDVCQVGWNGRDCLVTPAGLEALRTRSMLNYKLVNSPKDVRYIAPRSRKYIARGFHLYVPLAFQDEVLTSAWDQALQMTERMKKQMVQAEAKRRTWEKEEEMRKKKWQTANLKPKHKSKPTATTDDNHKDDDAPLDLSSIPTPALTPSDMNTLKLDRGEGRRGHFVQAGSRVLPDLGAYEIRRAVLTQTEDEQNGDGEGKDADDDDEGEEGNDGQSTGNWEGETHYSGFLLNNDSMRVRQAFVDKVVRGENHAAEWL